MANKKYLVVHPKLSIIGKKGNQPLAKGEEVSLDADIAKRLIASGKVELISTKKKKQGKDLDAEALAKKEAAEKEAAEKEAEEQE